MGRAASQTMPAPSQVTHPHLTIWRGANEAWRGGIWAGAQGAEMFSLRLLASLERLSTISQQMPECWSQLQTYAAALQAARQEK